MIRNFLGIMQPLIQSFACCGQLCNGVIYKQFKTLMLMVVVMSQSSIPVPVFVINMEKSRRRRQLMTEKAQGIGIEIEFIKAVVGKDLSNEDIAACYNSDKRKRYFGRDMMRQEIGCLLSHRKIYEKIVAENIKAAVILEDDVIFEPDFVEAVRKSLDVPVKWDLIRFLSREKIFKKSCRLICGLPDSRFELVRIMGMPGGAYGYIISQNGARIMLQHMKKSWLPIDAIQGRVWETKMNCFALYPSPLYPDPEELTTIGGARFIKSVELVGAERFFYPAFRFGTKVYEAIGKRWGYYSKWLEDKSITHDT